MPDMLDIDHYLMEEDILRGVAMAEKPGEAAAEIRASLYQALYEEDYAYGGSQSADDDDIFEPAARPNRSQRVKPYIPPTDMTENPDMPYGNVVGAPLG